MERRIYAPLFAALLAMFCNFTTPLAARGEENAASATAAPRNAPDSHMDSHADDPRHAGHRHNPALDEIVVSAPLAERRLFDLIRGSNVLDEAALQRELHTTLGDTLARQPGIASSGFVPGAGRPVIRGLDGPRIRVLQNGIGAWDVSESSTDHHAVAADPALARRIEVLRGAGTLRFSNSAVGGVVNVLDDRISAERPQGAAGGLLLDYGSNADLRNSAGRLQIGAGNFAIHAYGGLRRSHDLEVRGAPLSSYAQSEADADDPLLAARGVVPNSALRSGSGGLGISRIFERGHIGIAWMRLDSRFGVPLPHGHHEEDDHGMMGGADMDDHGMDDDDHDDDHADEEDARVELDTDQDRFDLAGNWRGLPGPFDTLNFHGVFGDFTQNELEDGQAATRFTRRGSELRIELGQRDAAAASGLLEGVLGVQLRDEKRGADGLEAAFNPSHASQLWALFAAEEISWERFNLEGGLRIERTALRPDKEAVFARRNFTTWSASLGASWTPMPDLLFGVSLSRSGRPPSAGELHANGVHTAAASYEVGNANLKREEVWNAELTARRRLGRITGSFNLFVSRFDGFIFLRPGMTRDCDEMPGVEVSECEELPVLEHAQADANFRGGELELDLALPLSWADLSFQLGADYVRGEYRGGAALPRIPPLRLRLGAELQTRRFDLHADWLRVAKQSRVAAGERSSAGYNLLGAEIGFRPLANRPGLAFFVQGRNLTDRAGRSHVSLHKERVPIPGRDIRVGMRMQF